MRHRQMPAVLIAAALALLGCSTAAKTPDTRPQIASLPADLAGLPADPALNPRVTPALAGITVSPDLPVVVPPEGMISQETARQIALKAQYPMPVVLSLMQFDKANSMWEIHFTTDRRSAMAPRSHPGQQYTSDDPAQRRKEEQGWSSIATELHMFLDGRTGEPSGGGFAGGKPNLTRSDLEHYRGRILIGGEAVRLRLINADGSREGRDIAVDIPSAVLTDGLALWQLTYGMGQVLDVWGLTGPEGRVVAYKLSLPHPPAEQLLANRLVESVPVMPNAVDQPGTDSSRVMRVPGTTIAETLTWYTQQMPAYGWRMKALAEGPGNSVQFENIPGVTVQVSISEAQDGVQIALTWPVP